MRVRAMAMRRGLDVIYPPRAAVPLLPLRLVRVPPRLRPSHVGARAQDPQQQEDAGDGPDHDARYGATAEDAALGAGVVRDDRRRRLADRQDPREGFGEGPRWLERGCRRRRERWCHGCLSSKGWVLLACLLALGLDGGPTRS